MVKLLPEFTGVNPNTGEYLSPDERKQVFKLRKRKLDPSKVFDKSAIVKVDKPQANMDSVMKSIANIQETLQKLQTIIVTDAEEKKKETTKENRQLLLAGEREKRKKKEGLLEKVPERLKNALLSPVKAVGEQAKGILSKLMAAFELIFVGWLTNKGFKAIQAFMDGDKEKLKSIGMNVLAGLGAVGGIFVAMNLGILALPAIIAKVIAVISTVGSAIIGFLLSPPGLITLAIAAGIGAAFLGIKKLNQFLRGGKDAEEARDRNKKKLREAGVMKVVGDRGADVIRDGEKVFVKTEDLTDEERAAVEAYKLEQQRIRDVTKNRDKELGAVKGKIKGERAEELERLRAEAEVTGDKSKVEAFKQETKRLIKEEKERIRSEAADNYSNPTANVNNISPTGNESNIEKSVNNPNIDQSFDGDNIEVSVNNIENSQGGGSLKDGASTNVASINSSDDDNMYTAYTQSQIGTTG